MFKRFLNLVLALSFAMSLMSINVFADEWIEEGELVEIDLEVEFFYDEDTDEFIYTEIYFNGNAINVEDLEEIMPYGSDYFNYGRMRLTISGSTAYVEYYAECFGADLFEMTVMLQSSSNGSSWVRDKSETKTTTGNYISGEFSSSYSSNRVYRLQAHLYAYVNGRLVATDTRTSS